MKNVREIKENDIYYIKRPNGKDFIVYIMEKKFVQFANNSYTDVIFAKVTLTTCNSVSLKEYEFHNIYREKLFLENGFVEPMEIMNLTDKYPEYLI